MAKHKYIIVKQNPFATQFILGMSGANVYITTSPTANCQVSTLGAFNTIFILAKDIQLRALALLHGLVGTNMLIVDVQLQHRNAVKELMGPENVVVESPYKSTNGSDMVLFLIKANKLKNEYASLYKAVIEKKKEENKGVVHNLWDEIKNTPIGNSKDFHSQTYTLEF